MRGTAHAAAPMLRSYFSATLCLLVLVLATGKAMPCGRVVPRCALLCLLVLAPVLARPWARPWECRCAYAVCLGRAMLFLLWLLRLVLATGKAMLRGR